MNNLDFIFFYMVVGLIVGIPLLLITYYLER